MQHVAAEMQRDDFFRVAQDPAADRRRDDEPRAHRGEDRAALRRPGRLRARREPQRRRLQRPAQRRQARRRFIAELEADYERVRAAAREQEGDAAGHARRGARQQDADRLGRLHAAGAEVHRPPRAAQPRPRRDRRAASTGGRSSRPGTSPGPYPAILNDEIVGESARRVFSDGKRMLQRVIEGRWLRGQRRRRPVSGEHRRRRRHRDLRRRVAPRGADALGAVCACRPSGR